MGVRARIAWPRNLLGSYLAQQRAIREFWKWNEQDEIRLRFYRQFMAPGNLVFDVGANFGNRTKIFLALGAKVVAFEPQPGCVERLAYVLGKHRRFLLAPSALGEKEGSAELIMSKVHVLSTLSDEWISRTKLSGRFDRWESWENNERRQVDVSTLELAIERFGLPAFIKIDVEGFELPVLRGLKRPIRAISFEFAGENLDDTLECVDYIDRLAPSQFRVSLGESMHFRGDGWRSAQDIRTDLVSLAKADRLVWGDVYARTLRALP
jgi:FkbM family methyltransferase